MSGWMTAEDAAARLGVKPTTLYAYVSRGIVTRRRDGAGRSLFDSAQIEQLALRGRPRRPANAGPELVIRSAITRLGTDRPYYRGFDALVLAGWCELEDVAALLWTDVPPRRTGPAPRGAGADWQTSARVVDAGRAAQRCLPDDVLPLERLQVVAPILAAYDPLRLTGDPAAIVHIGQVLVAGLVDCLPDLGAAAPDDHGPISGRLWSRLTARPADPALRGALRTALVLLADHELAASTVAARMAASVRADPYAVVMAGLGTMSGALHGGASLGAESLLAEIDDPAQAAHVLGQRLRRGERIPGFGHAVYRAGDGRAAVLLDAIRAAVPDHPKLAAAGAVIAEADRRLGRPVNVDFALALLGAVAGMVPGSGEAIFAIARTVGWLAHAIEEYADPMRLRLRATYTGPPPDRGPD